MNKLKNDKLLNALCLNHNDNILITLKNINSGVVLNKFGIKTDSPALSGQKIAKIDINVPIGCGDVAVWPNDLIVGDKEGVVVVPNNKITDISKEVKFMTIYEDYVLKKVKKGSSLRGLYTVTNEDEKNNFEAWLSRQS